MSYRTQLIKAPPWITASQHHLTPIALRRNLPPHVWARFTLPGIRETAPDHEGGENGGLANIGNRSNGVSDGRRLQGTDIFAARDSGRGRLRSLPPRNDHLRRNAHHQ